MVYEPTIHKMSDSELTDELSKAGWRYDSWNATPGEKDMMIIQEGIRRILIKLEK